MAGGQATETQYSRWSEVHILQMQLVNAKVSLESIFQSHKGSLLDNTVYVKLFIVAHNTISIYCT